MLWIWIILLGPCVSAKDGSSWNFIENRVGTLFQNGEIFKFTSYNVPGLFMTEDRGSNSNILAEYSTCSDIVTKEASCTVPKNDDKHSDDKVWITPTLLEQEDAILSIKGLYGQVIRTYTLGFGPNYHFTNGTSLNEKAFVAMDNALALAKKHGIRLMIPFVNNHEGGDQQGPGNFGDYATICAFRDLKPSQFFASKIIRNDLKSMIKIVLDRINTVNQVRYGDDPTILAWQLGNELGGESGAVPPLDWILEISSFFKKLAPNTLIADGTYGFQNLETRVPPEVIQSNSIDIISNHYYYGGDDLDRISRHAKFVTDYGKAFIIGEYGFGLDTTKKILAATLENKNISGALAWSLRYHARDGGFYSHSEGKDILSYHVPGFARSEDLNDAADLNHAKSIRIISLKILGLPEDTFFPIPDSAQEVLGSIDPTKLRWFGSAWAASYNIFRKNDSGTFHYLQRVDDNKIFGSTLFSDPVSAGQYTYMIKPVSVEGLQNNVSPLILGPFVVY